MRTLIVDDEPIARRELARLLSEHPEVEIVGEASDVPDALRKVDALEPDLLFLDIKMPGHSGFDLLEQMDLVPYVVFTTAFDEYAVRAFEVNALDYLLKPIEPMRLAAAIERAQKQINGAEQKRTEAAPFSADRRVFVREGERCWLVHLRDVVLFESDGNTTRLVFGDQRPSIRKTLAYLEGRLDPVSFFRANRSQIIGLRHVEAVEPWFGERLLVQLRGGHRVELSRRRSQQFRGLGL